MIENNESEMSLDEARKLADYYGILLCNKSNTLWSKEDILGFTEALYYCRYIILKRRIKR